MIERDAREFEPVLGAENVTLLSEHSFTAMTLKVIKFLKRNGASPSAPSC